MPRTTIYPSDQLHEKVKIEAIKNKKYSSASDVYCSGAMHIVDETDKTLINEIETLIELLESEKQDSDNDMDNYYKGKNMALKLAINQLNLILKDRK